MTESTFDWFWLSSEFALLLVYPSVAALVNTSELLLATRVRRIDSSVSMMPDTRLMAVTIAAWPLATVPPKNCVYSPVAATARRYVRSVAPDRCRTIAPPVSSAGTGTRLMSSRVGPAAPAAGNRSAP
jgi:hypothetical protein